MDNEYQVVQIFIEQKGTNMYKSEKKYRKQKRNKFLKCAMKIQEI